MTPLLGIGVCVSIQFAGMEYSKRLFSTRNVASGIGDGSLTGSQYFASGVIAGLSNSVVSGPVEHIRIRRSFSFRDDRRNVSFRLAPQLRFTHFPLLSQVCRHNPIKPDSMLARGTPSRRSTPRTESPEFTRDKSRPWGVRLADTGYISGRMRS